MKNLPIGKQTFKEIIEENNLYVDKTEEIFKLLDSHGKYFFLSRPRRFGKSLLITTLEEIFLGNKELFKDLWIYDKMIPQGSPGNEWKKYPVIKLSMNDLTYSEGLESFKTSLFNRIREIFNKYDLKIESPDYKEAFKELILKLSKTEKVILLIDEYDKPIIEYIEHIEKAKEMRDILKNFYETVKANDEYIHFAFLTGVSKFSKVSVFSALNNLNDITLDDNYSKLVGIDEEQLYSYFADRITLLAKKINITEDDLKKEIRNWYNGYSWDGKNFVYNPYSLLLLFDKQRINNYWYQTGTPTFLIKLIKEFNLDIKNFERSVLNEEDFSTYEVDKLNVNALLFQTGYLTIKEIIDPNSPFREYVLSYPNMEVRESLNKSLLNDFTGISVSDRISIREMIKSLQKKDVDSFFRILKSLFGSIPHEIFPEEKTKLSDKEAYYHTIFYLIFKLIGLRINAEVSVSKGRIDAVVETDDNVYIFEFKVGRSPKKALEQIEKKGYFESYLASKKEIVKVGVNFSIGNRNIKSWEIRE